MRELSDSGRGLGTGVIRVISLEAINTRIDKFIAYDHSALTLSDFVGEYEVRF